MQSAASLGFPRDENHLKINKAQAHTALKEPSPYYHLRQVRAFGMHVTVTFGRLRWHGSRMSHPCPLPVFARNSGPIRNRWRTSSKSDSCRTHLPSVVMDSTWSSAKPLSADLTLKPRQTTVLFKKNTIQLASPGVSCQESLLRPPRVTHTHIHTYTLTHLHTYTLTHTHTHTYTHTHNPTHDLQHSTHATHGTHRRNTAVSLFQFLKQGDTCHVLVISYNWAISLSL